MNIQLKCLKGFAQYPQKKAAIYRPEQLSQCDLSPNHTYIARGQGGSYGDAALPIDTGVALSTERLNRFLAFDPKEGLLSAESGVVFHDIIHTFLPRGWFPFVVPGTQYVSLGGAFASDIHGKNHHHVGSFSNHVKQCEILMPSGLKETCYPDSPLFQYTAGAQGLTGCITQLALSLQSVESAYIKTQYHACDNVEKLFDRLAENAAATYQVAWLDGLARNQQLGKGIVINGEHARLNQLPKSLPPFSLPTQKTKRIPSWFPAFLLNRLSLSVHNHFYYRRHQTVKSVLLDYNTFFFPLDHLRNWYQLYSHRGFIQYQVVFPPETARSAVRAILEILQQKGHWPRLVVLKNLGAAHPNAPLAFPMPGYTLAIDLAIDPRLELFDVLRQCDEITCHYKGRVYLSKDARLSKTHFEIMYPKHTAFKQFKMQIDPYQQYQSALSSRLGLTT